jgi:hypothetical protein
MIVFRYAINFHSGFGWVMNPGEHVNGCSSWFGLLLSTLLTKFFTVNQSIVALKVLGIICGFVVLRKSQEMGAVLLPKSPLLSAVVPLLLAYRTDFALSMINGMETPYACVFLLCGLTTICRSQDEAVPRSTVKSVPFFVLAGLSRPELFIIFPALFAVLWLNKVKVSIWQLVAYLIPFGVIGLFSLSFYHAVLPNTYYAKQVGFTTGLLLGGSYAAHYLLVPFALPALLTTKFASLTTCTVILSGFCSLLCLLALSANPGRATLLVVVTIGLYLLFLLRTGGDWMMDGRFAMPVLPLVACSWLAGLDAGYRAVGNADKRVVRIAVVAAFTIFVLGAVADNETRVAAIDLRAPTKPITANVLHGGASQWMCAEPTSRIRLALWIQEHLKSGQTAAISEIGLITVMNPSIRFIDTAGLTDATIARLPNYDRRDFGVSSGYDWDNLKSSMGRYIERRHPDYVVSAYGDGTQIRNPHYEKVDSLIYNISVDKYRFIIYKRKG